MVTYYQTYEIYYRNITFNPFKLRLFNFLLPNYVIALQ